MLALLLVKLHEIVFLLLSCADAKYTAHMRHRIRFSTMGRPVRLQPFSAHHITGLQLNNFVELRLLW